MSQPRLAYIATHSGGHALRGSVADAIAAGRTLTTRDRELIALLADHKALTTDQIARLFYGHDNTARKRLVRLTDRGILARFRTCVRPGSQSWRYTLGTLGAMIHAAAHGDTLPTAAKTREKVLKLAQNPRLNHLLGVNEFFVTLTEHARKNNRCNLAEWWNEQSITEACARIVRPDGYGKWVDGDRATGLFIEYDTGTEKLETVLSKLDGYRELASADVAHPILFVLPGVKRQNNFHRLASANPATLGGLTVASAAAEDLATTGPADAVWLLAGTRTRYRLIDLPRPTAHRRAA
ncbi:replication-relaxation family protein [Amycolatopsis sp. NBC_01488]|uniref:replication-relaxation family protein n=1 Tax=Amycolatopsis sp. NBC_01488 TaxID=2903563 RepID=UPI002E2876BA|nr:replication-relaxation family protein [Amycolatopsis sp. NBC_01488]